MPKRKRVKQNRFDDPDEHTLKLVRIIRKKYYANFKNARIRTIMRNGKWHCYGTIRAVSEEQRKTGVEADYILNLSAEAWRVFTPKQKKALIDHELAHMVVKVTKRGIVYRCRKHDLEEFSSIVERYGDWLPSIAAFHRALKKGSRANG